MQKDQKLINEVKSSILEGYDVIPASVKINYSLEETEKIKLQVYLILICIFFH